LTAYLNFDRLAGDGKEDPKRTYHFICQALLKVSKHIDNDPWRGIPELTNAGELDTSRLSMKGRS
jgi:glycogen debranching enzyme